MIERVIASPQTRHVLNGAFVGLVASALVLGSDAALTRFTSGGVQILQAIEAKTYDWRLSHGPPVPRRPARTSRSSRSTSTRSAISQPNAGRWPWPRVVHAELLDYLARAHAKVIAYDVNCSPTRTSRTGFNFGEATISGADSDKALADSDQGGRQRHPARRRDVHRRVDGARHRCRRRATGSTSRASPSATVVFPPFDVLARRRAGLGHNLFVLDPDGAIRHTVPFVRSGRRAMPSLGLAAALRVAGVPPDRGAARRATSVGRANARCRSSGERCRPQTGTERYLWGLITFAVRRCSPT